jgi:hypothetical protein
VTAHVGTEIWTFIGKAIAAGGGGAVVAFGIFRVFGKGWMEHEFAKRLEAAKAEISVLTARKLKLHDREYIVFPELWSKLNRVFGSLNRAVISFRQVPDFQRMQKSDLESWLKRSGFSDAEKSYFTEENDKSRAYGRILEFQGLNEAHKDYFEFHTYLENNRIFLSPEIKQKLGQIDTFLWNSWVAKKMDLDLKGFSQITDKDYLRDAWDTLDKKVKPLMAEIESLVQARLFPESHAGEQAGSGK